MKKLIAFSVVVIAIFAFTLKPDIYFVDYTGVATDTVGVGTTTWNYPVEINKTDGVFYSSKVKVMDVTAGAQCTIALQGKYFDDDDYSTITTKTWYGGGTDTTVVFQNVATKSYYRYMRVLVTRTANKAKIGYVKLSLKK